MSPELMQSIPLPQPESSLSEDKAQIIIQEARSWIGTRFAHQGRSKKLDDRRLGGVDCVGLVIEVFKSVGVRYFSGSDELELDFTNYSRVGSSSHLLSVIDKFLLPCDSSKIKPADVLVINFQGVPRHLILATSPTSFIHSYESLGKVIEQQFTPSWERRIIKKYRVLECQVVNR